MKLKRAPNTTSMSDFTNQNDLTACWNNGALLLRLSGRYAECENLLQRGLQKVPKEAGLWWILALAQAHGDRLPEALMTLAAAGDDPDSQLLECGTHLVSRSSKSFPHELRQSTRRHSTRVSANLRWSMIGRLHR